jgi:phosphohistidine phosphatase SixA
MKVVFIRHSKALEKELWDGADKDRPLHKKGKVRAEVFAKQLAALYPNVSCIYSAESVRTTQTADIIGRRVRPKTSATTPLLNKGFNLKAFEFLMDTLSEGIDTVFLVGHCPDIVDVVYQLTGTKEEIQMKKPSSVEVEFRKDRKKPEYKGYFDGESEEIKVFRTSEPHEEAVGEIDLGVAKKKRSGAKSRKEEQ